MPEALWDITPHTKAKHMILRKYVEAWAPILSQGGFNGRIAYIDGFAGPGKYATGEDGSPVVVLNALRNHVAKERFRSEFVNLFVEENKERSQILEDTIKDRCSPLPKWIKYEVIHGEFNEVLSEIISKLEKEGQKLAPCLCFVDPFGWSDLVYSVLANFMKYEKAELLITFMAGYLSRFVWDEAHMNSIEKLFNGEQIAAIKQAPNSEGAIMKFFLENLKGKMKESGIESEVFHLAFSACNEYNRLEYYLIYISKSCKGFEAMKAAMYSAAQDGSYRFSDFEFDPGQTTLVDYFNITTNWVVRASEEVMNYLLRLSREGKGSIPIKQVKGFITCRTVWKYEKAILEYLENNNKIDVKVQNRKGQTYPDRGSISVH